MDGMDVWRSENQNNETNVGIVGDVHLPDTIGVAIAIPVVVHTPRRRMRWPVMGLGGVDQCIGQWKIALAGSFLSAIKQIWGFSMKKRQK